MADWAEEQAAANRTTPTVELQKLAERNNFKWEAMGRELGVAYQVVMSMCRRHNYKKPHCKAFEFGGKVATLTQHCKDHGIPEGTISVMKWRNPTQSARWALEKCLTLRGLRMKESSPPIRGKTSDPVNHPAHYTGHVSGVECIEVTRWLSFNRGNAFKYIFRRNEKASPRQDLSKALWYVRDAIKNKQFETGIHEYGRRAANKIIKATPELWEAQCYLFLVAGGLPALRECEARIVQELAK